MLLVRKEIFVDLLLLQQHPQPFQPVCQDFQGRRGGHGNADCFFGRSVSDKEALRTVDFDACLSGTDLKAFPVKYCGSCTRRSGDVAPLGRTKFFRI